MLRKVRTWDACTISYPPLRQSTHTSEHARPSEALSETYQPACAEQTVNPLVRAGGYNFPQQAVGLQFGVGGKGWTYPNRVQAALSTYQKPVLSYSGCALEKARK